MAKTDWMGVAVGLVGAAVTWLFPTYRWMGWLMLGIGAAILLYHLASWWFTGERPRQEVAQSDVLQTRGLLWRDVHGSSIRKANISGADIGADISKSTDIKFGELNIDRESDGSDKGRFERAMNSLSKVKKSKSN
jgi:hypothetical protein